jgi:diguanylate cyclase (GGDEF)-like protein
MTGIDNDLTLMRKTELFTNLHQKELDFVISNSGTIKLPKGGLLFSSGEEAGRFFILTNGAIRVFKPRSDGGADEMAIFKPGDTIGDFDFARGAVYDASAEASDDSELIEFPGYGLTMDSLAQKEPRIICSILLNAIVMMTDRIKSTRKLILENMSWVKELYRRAYEDSGTGLWKQVLITDEIIGNLKDPAALIMLKPDRFKILVDSRGHSIGDEAMVRIAMILKNIARRIGNGWPLRFKSNEVGIIFNNCGSATAEKISGELAAAVAAMKPVPANDDNPPFYFSASISWSVWPADDAQWESLFQGNYNALMDAWRAGGNKISHYSKTAKQ